MPPTRSTLPPATRNALIWMRLSAAARDVCMIGVGILGLLATPPSVDVLGVSGPASIVWSLSFLVGGLLALVGGVRNDDPTHAAGCFVIMGGFLIWAVAALALPGADSVTLMVGLVFLAGVFGQVYRGLGVAVGLVQFAHDALAPGRRIE